MLSCSVLGGRDVADDDRDGIVRGGAGDLADGLAAAGNKRRLLQQIGRGIAADGQLRKEDEVGASLLRAPRKFKNLSGVAAEIADGRIDLSQRDLHLSSVATRAGEAADTSGIVIPPGIEPRLPLLIATEASNPPKEPWPGKAQIAL